MIFCFSTASGQVVTKAEILKNMDLGVKYANSGDYKTADKYYRWVLKNAKVLPTDISFHFGKNSYYLGRYKQSIDWLNKYIELKGSSGRYFDSSKEYLELAEERFRKSRETEEQNLAEELSRGKEFECHAGDKVTCPVCNGSGVIVRPGKFGAEYITCPYSDEQGLMTCENYRLWLRGDLQSTN